MSRRTWVLGAAGAAAAAAGIGWRLLQSAPGEPAPADLWTLRFERPEGGTLDFAALRGRPLLVNFWATWCPPCIKELPDLDRFQRSQPAGGWQVVGLAVDAPTPVRQFLQRTPLTFAIGLAGMEGAELGKRWGNTQGGLPFTVAFDAAGRLRHRKLGQTQYEELVRWAAET